MTENYVDAREFGPDEVMKILPHRYPFLMVDRVTEVRTSRPLSTSMPAEEILEARKGSTVRAIKNVTFNEAQFQGHFPGYPIFPGVLTLESMAQTAFFVVVPFAAALNRGKLPKISVVLAGMDGVRFRRPIRPGDRMDMMITVANVRGSIWSFEGVTEVEGKKAAEGSFLAHLEEQGQ